jgi:RimJ/RimL family protein N-acetyltransferase
MISRDRKLVRSAMTPATYSASEQLRDGRLIHIRALRPDDEAGMLAAVDQTHAESLRRRFFVTKRKFSEKEKAFFLHVDFVNHVALVAAIDEGNQHPIVGSCRYIVTEPGSAEVAFVVIDAYQGQGLGTILTRHLVGLARSAGLEELTADVLLENTAMRNVLSKCGFQASPNADPQVIHLTLALTSPR